jgi:4-amino-4-deoxy-L-arabinose transferase-like glycosyltransferase
MIAWLIAATTSVFGQAEWAVRLASPLLHTGTAALLFLTGRNLFDARVGFYAAAIYALMPAVWLSSFIISTDVALLFFWALALHAWACLREHSSWARAGQLGLAIGLGLMSKYAMLFFLPTLLLAAIFDPRTREAVLNTKGLAVAALALACLAPNLMWNAAHDFATVSHTAANANLESELFQPLELLGFWRDQLAVFGPITLILLALALIAGVRCRLPAPAMWLAVFCLVPLLVISAQALLSRANANWAVSAYAGGALLLAVWTVGGDARAKWVKAALAVQTVIALVIGMIALNPPVRDALGLANATKRMVAWPETTQAIREVLKTDDYAGVATDDRLVHYDLDYYGIADMAPLYMWQLNANPAHHAELTRALPAGDGPYLIVSRFENFATYFKEDFVTVEKLESIEIPLGGGKVRRLSLFKATGYTPTTRTDRR